MNEVLLNKDSMSLWAESVFIGPKKAIARKVSLYDSRVSMIKVKSLQQSCNENKLKEQQIRNTSFTNS